VNIDKISGYDQNASLTISVEVILGDAPIADSFGKCDTEKCFTERKFF
jgi:hypothetical protein